MVTCSRASCTLQRDRFQWGWPFRIICISGIFISQVLHNLQSNRVRILVMGDSIMRQLHVRLAHMFRGSAQAVDYRVGGLARYAVCRAGDSFTVLEQ